MRYVIFLLFFCFNLNAFTPQPISPYPVVGYKEIPFFDEAHQMKRAILVWYPVASSVEGQASPDPWDVFKIAPDTPIFNAKEKKPVVIISHGYGGTPHQLSWLIEKLVHNNYIVIGLQHLDKFNGTWQINSWQRPQDVQMLLDQFTSHPFAKSADLNCIGFAGYSMGGSTGIWIAGGRSTRLDPFVPTADDAYPEEFKGVEQALGSLDKEKMAQDWRDERIKAVFLMAPSWGWIFNQKDLQAISIPTYIVAPTADEVLVTKNNAEFFCKSIPHSTCQIIPGKVGHYVFMSEPIDKRKLPSDLAFLIKDNPSTDRKWIQYETAENAVNFFDSTLK